MPVPTRLQDPSLRRPAVAALLAAWLCGGAAPPAATQGSAFFVRDLANPRQRREARADLLDTPVLPGSVVKALTLVSALEAGVVRPETGVMCRRVVSIDGVRFTCAHPDLRRPLTPDEALAHSCNDFFVSLAPRLSRAQVNRTRTAAGLPPLAASTPLGPALVGLDGPRTSPRALVDVLARLAGVGPDPPVPMAAATRQVLLAGLAGAARYGTASALGERGLSAWAKTGTAPMPGGGVAGVVVALAPAPNPTQGLVVVAPGAAGLDAAALAADLLAPRPAGSVRPASPSSTAAPAIGTPADAVAASTIRLGRTLPGGRTRIDTVPLDDYVAEVLAGEGQPRAGDAAQQALAVTARTYALANRQRHRAEGFDLCDTTHCQVVRPSTETTRRAAAATGGQVLLAGGRPASIFYSAWCGGRLERASNVWPGATDHRHPARDDACASEPPWESEIRAADVERALRAAGLRGGRLRALRVVQRNASGRVERLHAEGLTPPHVSGHDFRMAMGRVGGWQLVKSTAFEVRRTGSGYRFRGTGFGHGVGLCVVGAGARAGRGESAEAILRFYFPDLTIGRVDAAAPAAAGGPPVADVQLSLPVAEEGERPAVVAAIRQARDDIARAAGTSAPPGLRVTVHPTVESFARATGQPWWVAGATSGAHIELLPLSILRQRGILEQTLRHEVAHALLDGALAGRPAWVREGAAIVFGQVPGAPADAGSPAGTARTGGQRVTCPTDDELRRPVSAGAQRDAYARAGACFRRALAAGQPWRDVR